MRFIDEAKIKIAGGHGGPGCVSFRRETFVPRGGPDGGNGGKGGDVIFQASSQLGSLRDFRFKRIYLAENGLHGSGSNKSGRDGEDTLIRIPVGTVIKDTESGEVLADLTQDGETWLACKGGRGGKGNAHFTTSTHQAPKFAQPGEEGETREILLELKLLADVGIIGFPNAGKSTLISKISAARPKIADYPFTTLTPNLGMVYLPNHQSFVVADIPGLVEGAHRGIGLGHKFLKHIERTSLFLHLLDGTKILEELTAPDDSTSSRRKQIEAATEQLIERYIAIRNELGQFNEKLLHKPELVVINKIDTMESDFEILTEIQHLFRQRIASIRGTHPVPSEPFLVSAVSGRGIDELLSSIQRELESIQPSRIQRRDTKTDLLPDDEGMRA